MKRGYADGSRGQIHYVTEGEGEVLLLLHQSVRSAQSFSKVMPYLSKTYRVVAMDNPGFGSSDPLTEPFTVSDLAKFAYDLLDALKIKSKVRVFGHHTGAAIGAEMAIQAPDRIEALALSGFPYMAHDDERKLFFQRSRGQGGAGGLPVVVSELDGSHLLKLWSRASARLWWGKNEGRGAVPLESATREDLDFLNGYVLDALTARHHSTATFIAVFDYDSDGNLPKVKAPTLFLEGSSPYERAICQRSEVLIEKTPNSKLIILDNADANVLFWKPKELSELLLRYFKDPAKFQGKTTPKTGPVGRS